MPFIVLHAARRRDEDCPQPPARRPKPVLPLSTGLALRAHMITRHVAAERGKDLRAPTEWPAAHHALHDRVFSGPCDHGHRDGSAT